MQLFRRFSPRRPLIAAALLALFASGTAAAQEPVIFVHGYANGPSNFNTMVSRFVGSGYPSSKLYRFSYASTVNSNRTSASQFASFVSSVRSSNGNSAVSVIGHSNGGLVTRWYRAKLGGTTGMRRFIALGTPHNGSTWAYSCITPVCFEMRPYSVFLTDLAGAGCDRSLWSASDGLVVPATSAKCGYSVQTANVSHMSLLTDQSVYNQIRSLLQ